jgi:K+-sensing histidine kinase KdpD
LAGFLTFLSLSVGFESSRHISRSLALATFALGVTVCAALVRAGAAFLLAACAFLDFNGFVVGDTDGSLHWHGTADVVRLGVLFACACGALLMRRALRGDHGGADPR